MRITGNKGEWSELYALLKLLSLGRLYAADENADRIPDIFFPILKILREESYGEIDFIITKDGDTEVYINNIKQCIIPRRWLMDMSSVIYSSIVNGDQSAFEINGAPAIMNRLGIEKITASSADKTDIILQIHDIHTGYAPICGFSIKSELGSSPTLLNASGATNFLYEIPDIPVTDINRINAINTKTKVKDRILEILSHGNMKYVRVQNSVFSGNLKLIDTELEIIISELLLAYYSGQGVYCHDLIKIVEDQNPMRYPWRGFYEYKFKKFLCSVALGLMPSKRWNGIDEANGGYVIVKEDGDVVAYHLYNRNSFESYLLNSTKFETASTSRHGFASIFRGDSGKKYINLNLQIRFN